MRMIIATAIVLAGVGGGLALGVALRPAPESGGGRTDAAGHGKDSDGQVSEVVRGDTASVHLGDPADPSAEHGGAASSGEEPDGEAERNYVKLGRQIVVPVVVGGQTRALMLFDLAIDVPRAMTEQAYAAEPRLRDALLRELFDMSYSGAFLRNYTDERVLDELRGKLRAAARRVLGEKVEQVLVLDIVRHEP